MDEKTCSNCKWVGCRNYGHEVARCSNHIFDGTIQIKLSENDKDCRLESNELNHP